MTVAYSVDHLHDPPVRWRGRVVGFSIAGVLGVAGLVLADRLLTESHAHTLDGYAFAEVLEGTLTVAVQGTGSLQPVRQRWITAEVSGIVESIGEVAGRSVRTGDLLIRLSNPRLDGVLRQYQVALAEARANRAGLLARGEDRRLAADAAVMLAKADADLADLRLRAQTQLLNQQAVSAVDHERARIQADRAGMTLRIEQRRREQLDRTLSVEVMASDAQLEVAELDASLAAKDVAALEIRATLDGTVQIVQVQPGESVSGGQKVARIADEGELRAEVVVPEAYAAELAQGQYAVVHVLDAEVRSVVVRVDPAVMNGSVNVHLDFREPLPDGIRPDLSVRATVTVREIEAATYVRRPSGVFDHRTVDVFVLGENGASARRTPVQFGAGTLSHVEVLAGLDPGDRVVLDSTARFGDAEIISTGDGAALL